MLLSKSCNLNGVGDAHLGHHCKYAETLHSVTEQMNIKTGSTNSTQNRTVVLKDASDPAFDDALMWETSGVLALRLLQAGVLP